MMFTSEEVKQKSSADHVLIIQNEKVYNVTDFVGRHPGGADVLLQNLGKDVTQVMESHHKHSKAAYQILSKYYTGDVVTSQADSRVTSSQQVKQRRQNGSTSIDNKDESPSLNCNGWRENELIDWQKPLVWQVGSLGKSYAEWVHSPVDRPIRFFKSNVMETFSMCPWWVIPMIWLPVAYFLFNKAYTFFSEDADILMPWLYGGIKVTTYWMPALFISGFFAWTLFEYCVHRYLFHLMPPADSPFLITAHFILHGQHHKAPMDTDRLVFPPVPAAAFSLAVWFFYSSLFPLHMAQVLVSGKLVGYVVYDLMHYYLHHGRPFTDYMRRLKKYHIQHHFVNQQKGYGISSKLWDYPFGTLLPDQ